MMLIITFVYFSFKAKLQWVIRYLPNTQVYSGWLVAQMLTERSRTTDVLDASSLPPNGLGYSVKIDKIWTGNR